MSLCLYVCVWICVCMCVDILCICVYMCVYLAPCKELKVPAESPLGRNTTSYTPGDQTHVSALYSFVCGTPFSELTIHIIVVCWLIVFETFHFFLASLTFPPPPPLLILTTFPSLRWFPWIHRSWNTMAERNVPWRHGRNHQRRDHLQ